MSAAEVARLRALVAEGIEAFRLTREYVGEDRLYPGPGWSWFDWTEKARAALSGVSEGAASDLRAAVWSAQHDSTCEDAPPHPWTGHLPWDSAEDEQDAIRQADAIIAALRSVPSPEPLDVLRLGEALRRTRLNFGSDAWWDEAAPYLAREYARLAAPQPVPEDET